MKESSGAQAAPRKSSPRACATAPALRLHCGALNPVLGSVPPRHPACAPAPSFRLRPGLARHCPPWVGGQLPAGRPVTPAAHFRLRRAAGAPALNGGEQVAHLGRDTGKTLWRSPTRARASPVRERWLQSWRLWFSARSGPAFASERSQWNRMRCRAWKLSVLHAQTLSPARPASSSSRAVGNVSVHDAVGFAADLENDFATSLPRRGRVGGREFPDCF